MGLRENVKELVNAIGMNEKIGNLVLNVVGALEETMDPDELEDCLGVTSSSIVILPKVALTEIMLDKCIVCLNKLFTNPITDYNSVRHALQNNIDKTAVKDPEAAAIIACIYYILYPKNEFRPSSKNAYDARKLSVMMPDDIRFNKDYITVRYCNFEFNGNHDLSLVYKVIE